MSHPVARWTGWFMALLLVGCATFPNRDARPEGGAAPDRALSGRISIHSHNLSSDHEETDFANFDWSEHGESVDLNLLDPLGQTIAKVTAAPRLATLTLRDGRVFSGQTPEELTTQVLGWTLPVSGLRAWLHGQPGRADAPAPKVDADGSRQFKEDGWTIVYPGTGDASSPRRVNLSYPGPGVALELKIVVDSRSGT